MVEWKNSQRVLHCSMTSAELLRLSQAEVTCSLPMGESIAKNTIDQEQSMELPPTPAPLQGQKRQLLTKAAELEAAFLSEMLAFSGLGELSDAFGGGEGEAQFASFLRREQARLMVEGGGIGLAELLFNALVRAEDDPAGITS